MTIDMMICSFKLLYLLMTMRLWTPPGWAGTLPNTEQLKTIENSVLKHREY
jgi:hypothetical protein